MAGVRDSGGTAKWLPYAGFCLAVAGIIYQGGALTNQVQQLERRMTAQEAVNSKLWDKLNDMNLRGARNEEKLDFLVTEAKEPGPKGRK